MSLCNLYSMNDNFKYITDFGCKKFNNSFILLIIYFCLGLCAELGSGSNKVSRVDNPSYYKRWRAFNHLTGNKEFWRNIKNPKVFKTSILKSANLWRNVALGNSVSLKIGLHTSWFRGGLERIFFWVCSFCNSKAIC